MHENAFLFLESYTRTQRLCGAPVEGVAAEVCPTWGGADQAGKDLRTAQLEAAATAAAHLERLARRPARANVSPQALGVVRAAEPQPPQASQAPPVARLAPVLARPAPAALPARALAALASALSCWCKRRGRPAKPRARPWLAAPSWARPPQPLARPSPPESLPAAREQELQADRGSPPRSPSKSLLLSSSKPSRNTEP